MDNGHQVDTWRSESHKMKRCEGSLGDVNP